MSGALRAPAPATLGSPPPRPRRAPRMLMASALVHGAVLAAVALLVAPGRPDLPVPIPVELVAPEEIAEAVAAGRTLPPLPRLELPAMLGTAGRGALGGGLEAMAARWPGMPVRIRPPRLSAAASEGLRAPDLPPPLPAMDGYDLESALVKRDAAPGTPRGSARPHPDNPPPLYPDAAKRLGLQGEAVVRVSVAADGRPRDPVLVQSSGWSVLDDAALDTVRRWRFERTGSGQPGAEVTVEVPIVFRLAGD